MVYPQANMIVVLVIRDSRCVPRVALACEECVAVCFFSLGSFSVLPSGCVGLPRRRVEIYHNGSAQVDSDV